MRNRLVSFEHKFDRALAEHVNDDGDDAGVMIRTIDVDDCCSDTQMLQWQIQMSIVATQHRSLVSDNGTFGVTLSQASVYERRVKG
jgi:hypothetical protein